MAGPEEEEAESAAASSSYKLPIQLPKAVKQAKKSAKAAMKSTIKKKGSANNLMRKRASTSSSLNMKARQVHVSGFMYKRRTGMTGLAASIFHKGGDSWAEGKFGGRLWLLRYFILRNGVISYFDVPKSVLEDVERDISNGLSTNIKFDPEPGSERASIDLGRFGVQLRMSYGHSSQMTTLLHGIKSGQNKDPENGETVPQNVHDDAPPTSPPSGSPSGSQLNVQQNGKEVPDKGPEKGSDKGDYTRSPSPYHLEIVHNNMLRPNDWQNWTLCCLDKRALFKWSSAISTIVYAQRGMHGQLLDDEAESDDGGVDEFEDLADFPGAGELSPIVLGEYRGNASDDGDSLGSLGLDSFSNEHQVRAPTNMSTSASRQVASGYVPVPVSEPRLLEVGVALCFSAIVLLFRSDIDAAFSTCCVIMANLIVIIVIHNTWRRMENIEQRSNGTLPAPVNSLAPDKSSDRSAGDKREKSDKKKEAKRISLSLSAPPELRPLGGTSVPFKTRDDIINAEQKVEHLWTIADDSVLMMRTGPDYKKYGNKAPTKPSLFDTIGVDLFESKLKLMDVAHRVIKAPFEKCADLSTVPNPFPQLLVINFQLPKPGGSLLSSADSPGYNFAVYYTPSQDLLDMINGKKPKEPVVPLLERWFSDAHKEGQRSLKERLKLVGFILNPEEVGMPSWCKGYNGKPVLIKKSGVITRDFSEKHSVYEVDIDLRQWGMLTRKGISTLLPTALSKMEFIVSLVIEGQENDELPERSLVATQISYLDTNKAEMVDDS